LPTKITKNALKKSFRLRSPLRPLPPPQTETPPPLRLKNAFHEGLAAQKGPPLKQQIAINGKTLNPLELARRMV
jgi:hypothetical protein